MSQTSEYSKFDVPPLDDREFESLRALIRRETGISLTDAKRDLLRTRLRKRLYQLGLSTFKDYYQFICDHQENSRELSELINCITTNKTGFFREAHHFTFLRERALPQFVDERRHMGEQKLRIWSAACSTGQEPYSIAISLKEFFGRNNYWDLRILASDINSACLATAARGIYGEEHAAPISAELKKRYFLRGTGEFEHQISVKRELRDLITFRRINFAAQKWPIHVKFDVIFCRNVIIYFDRDFQGQLLRRFLRYLSPSGYLILGHAENVSWMQELEPLGQTVYRLRDRPPTSSASISSWSSSSRKAPSKALSAIHSVQACPPGEESPSSPSAVHPKRAIVAGEICASKDPMEITTLLGSCIAACLYDPVAKVGGMNHFLLPERMGNGADTACYGINAMERLINEIMALGGDRSRMVAKLFGGARVLGDHSQRSNVGEMNIQFVRNFLALEGIPILEHNVGGNCALRVSMIANRGEVAVKELDCAASQRITQEDTEMATKDVADAIQMTTDRITLF